MKKRWICLFVENDVGVLAGISGMFSGKSSATVLIESVQTENRNNDLISLLEKCYANRIEIVRGGSVAIEALSITER